MEVPVMSDQTLRGNADDFIRYKKSLGYVYAGQEYILNRYVAFAESGDTVLPVPTKECVNGFLDSLSAVPGTLYQAVCVLREFSRHLQSLGYHEAYLIPPKIASQPIPEAPYFFTETEISVFFEKVDKIQPNYSFKGREIVIPALFRVLYCCGLRCKEARELLCENVHTEECFLDIIQSKGPKSRRIFISRELSNYLEDYDDRISMLFPDRKYYFPHGKGCYSPNFISGNFKRLWLEAFPEFEIGTRPRAYDFRHHFAWTNLNRWAADGMDLNVMLPYLMRYMGHQTISETLYYFHFVPEFFPTYKDMARNLNDVIPEVTYEK
jgi:integrase